MIDPTYALIAIVAMGIVTFGLRALPFVMARWIRSSSRVMELGRFLPSAIMVILLIHSIRDLAERPTGGGYVAEIVCLTLVMLLQWLWRKPLLSIVSGTALYMLWLNLG